MTEGKHEKQDEEPQEEFLGDSMAEEESKKEKSDSVKYDQWSIEDLRRKAKKNNISGHDKLNRNELIKNLNRL